MHSYRELVRPVDNKKIAGVAAGVAEYFGIDPTIARIIFVVLLFVGPGLPLYLLMWLVIPRDNASFIGEHSGGPSLWSILFKAAVIVASVLTIAEVAEDFSVAAFAGGLLVGLYFLYRGVSSSLEGDDDGDSSIYRSVSNKKILGVFGGLASRMGVDATLLRVIGAILLLVGFPLIVPAYLIYAMLVPRRDDIVIELGM